MLFVKKLVIKIGLYYRRFSTCCLILVLLSLVSFGGKHKQNSDGKALPLGVKEFYIAKVQDHRGNKSLLQVLVPEGQDHDKLHSVPLVGTDSKSLQASLLSSVTINRKLRPVEVVIEKLAVTEHDVAANRIGGNVGVSLSFHLVDPDGPVELVRYDGSAQYQRSFSNASVAKMAIDQALAGGVKYFNAWIEQEASKNVKLARGLKFHFEDYLHQETDTVYYSSDRPLVWDDFRDTPKSNQFGAEVFAGFGFDQRSYIKDGVVHVTITTKVFVPKSGSWVRPDCRNAYTLNHEQRHFDLAKIVAERFKKKILQANLSLKNYEGFMGPEYLEALREMNRLQEEYDSESSHGMNRLVQEQWNKKIDAELKGSGLN